MVNFNRRFWSEYREMAALAAAGAIGRVKRIELTLQVALAGWSSVTSHRTEAGEGGALEDLGSQMVDLALMLAGEGLEPVGGGARLHFVSSRGVQVECDVGYGNANRERVAMYGDRGRLVIANPNCTVHREPASVVGTIAAGVRDFVMLGRRALDRDTSMLRQTIRMALERFFAGVRSGERFDPGLNDGLRVARLLAAATEGVRH
jgi:predicted dehydrogenase